MAEGSAEGGLAALDRIEAALRRAGTAADRLGSADPGVRALVDAVSDAIRELDRLIGNGEAPGNG